MTYTWNETGNRHIMELNGERKWFVTRGRDGWLVYETVQDNKAYLRCRARSLDNAKRKAYQAAIRRIA